MAVGIVEFFEMIDIEHHQAKISRTERNLTGNPPQGGIKGLAVDETGQSVSHSLNLCFLQLPAQVFHFGSRRGQLVFKHAGPLLHLVGRRLDPVDQFFQIIDWQIGMQIFRRTLEGIAIIFRAAFAVANEVDQPLKLGFDLHGGRRKLGFILVKGEIAFIQLQRTALANRAVF